MDGFHGDISEDAARAERRAERLATVARARVSTLEMIERLNDGMAGRLGVDQQDLFDRVRDPYLAASRMTRELCRIVMLEERLDEDAETRAKRLAEEQAERERREAARLAELEQDAEAAVLDEKKQTVRRTIGSIYRQAFPDTTEMDLNRLLDPLLDEYELDLDEDFERAYGDVTAAVVRLCEELDITAGKKDGTLDKTPEKTRARLISLVEHSIAEVTHADAAANGNVAEMPVTAEPALALGQGPPG